MITVTNGEWIADLQTMTCRNIMNKVIVSFEIKGKFPQGKIQYIPMDLLSKLTIQPNGDEAIEKMVMEAEEVFMRAYFERDNSVPSNSVHCDFCVTDTPARTYSIGSRDKLMIILMEKQTMIFLLFI